MPERFFDVKSPWDIRADILEELGRIGSRLVRNEGSFASDMAGPLALELHKMYDQLRRIRPMVWVDGTSGPYLDLAAEELGIEPRKQATHATAVLEVTAEPGYLLPQGDTFLDNGGVLFDTVNDVTVPEGGVATVEAIAREPGSAGNVAAGEITLRYNGDTRVKSITNPKPAEGGSDAESDAGLYARIVFARQRPITSGNKNHYIFWALETPGVGVARVFPLWNGNGTVKVLIADDGRQPVDEETVRRCAAHIEGQRPTTARVTVVSAEAVTVNLSVTLQAETGLSETLKGQLHGTLCKQLAQYFADISLQESVVSYHRVGALLIALEGVADYGRLRLNGERADVQMAIEQVPALGEVDITWT